MKFNWGTGITIAMVLFMAFIVTLVVRISMESVELVSEDYYNLEMNYEDRIIAKSNAAPFKDSISITQHNGNVFIQFPNQINKEQVKGQIHLYRASNVAMDLIIPLSEIKENQIVIPESDISNGKYQVQISWQKSDKNYFLDKPIIVE